MTTSSSNIKDGFYCNDCFADVESECICDHVVGYDTVTGDVTEEEEAYHNRSITQDFEAGNSQNQRPEGNDMLLRDIDFVCELGDSKIGEIMQYELSDAYDMSLHEIDRLISLRRQ